MMQQCTLFWLRNILTAALCFLLLEGCPSADKKEEAKDAAATVISSTLNAYRLVPDRRFLQAVAEVHHFLTDEPADSVSVIFDEQSWTVSYRGDVVGTLPEIPDFGDFMGLLQQWAEKVSADHPIEWTSQSEPRLTQISGAIDGFSCTGICSALQTMDSLWKSGVHSPEMLGHAARGLAFMAVQTFDMLETADRIPVMGVTFLALSNSIAKVASVREEALLAQQMGYVSHAAKISESLPGNDPVRAFVRYDDVTLKRIAEGAGASLEARYLYLLRLAGSEDVGAYESWRRTFSSEWYWLPLFRADAMENSFGDAEAFGLLVPRFVLLDLAQQSGVFPGMAALSLRLSSGAFTEAELAAIMKVLDPLLNVSTGTLVNNFESGLNDAGRLYEGPFLDTRTWAAYYRAYFFSAYYKLGLHYLDALSSAEASVKFSVALGNSSAGLAAELQHWYRDLSLSKSGVLDPASLLADLGTLRGFGAPPLLRLYQEQKGYYGLGAPERLRAARMMAPRLDSRPGHVVELGSIAYEDLMDIPLAEKLLNRVVAFDPVGHAYSRAWHAALADDAAGVREVLQSPQAGIGTKVSVMRLLESVVGDSAESVRSAYNALVAKYPTLYSLRYRFSKYLAKNGRYADARHEMEDWLRREVPTAGLETISARSQIARIYLEEGRPAEAWTTIRAAVGSEKAEAMAAGAEAQLALGATGEAERICRDLVSRYPDRKTWRIAAARLQWKMGHPEEAAAVIRPANPPISIAEWQFDVAPVFAESYKGRSPGSVREAVLALTRAGVPPISISQLAVPFRKAGRHEVALAIHSELHAPGLENLVYLIECYMDHKSLYGKDEARRWLSEQVPPPLVNPSSMVIYEKEVPRELLWDFIRNPEAGEHPDYVWLLRAADFVRARDTDPVKRDALLRYFSNAGDGENILVGRYLLGLLPEGELFDGIAGYRDTWNDYYFCGLKAQMDGRYEDASRWYHVCIGSCRLSQGEYRWAYSVLFKWYSSGKSLELIQRARE